MHNPGPVVKRLFNAPKCGLVSLAPVVELLFPLPGLYQEGPTESHCFKQLEKLPFSNQREVLVK